MATGALGPAATSWIHRTRVWLKSMEITGVTEILVALRNVARFEALGQNNLSHGNS